MSNLFRASVRRSALTGVSMIAMLGVAGVAQAQEAQVADLDQVVVTASRIVRDGYEAPTPTTVIGAAEIAKQAPANIADFVNKLPQLGSAGSPRTTTANAGSGTGGANFLNTRNLGPNRTLVLLDGKRVVGSRLTGAVDVNMLPTALVSRVDVVTGGASAAWGSDAVAGVVNFVLDTKFTGLKGTAAYGQSFLGDAGGFNGDLSFGAPFAGGRGHVIVSGRLQTGDPVDEIRSRDWFTGYKAIPNVNRTATNGQPGFLAVNNAGLGRATDGSVIVSGPLAGTQFFANGTFGPYRLATQGSGILGAGGDVQDVAGRFALLPWLRQKGLFGRVGYDLTDDINVYGELSWSRSNTLNHSTPYVRHGDITIRADNAFIPAGLNLQGLTQFQIGRTNFDLDMTHSRNIRELTRWVGGVDGKTDWFDSSFRWNAYYQHGTSEIYNEISNNPIRANFDRAFDSVRNPATGGVPGVAVGTPVCRSTITNPTNGCVAFNWVGYGSPSQAAINYVNGVAWQQVTMKQDVAAAGAQFEPFSTWAGPVSLAAGYEWRKEQYKNTTDPLSPTAGTPYWFGNYKLGSGSYTVNEAFGELIVPIVRDAPFIKSLDLNGAVRATKYSTTGRVTTWKAGGTWDVNDELRLRATKSRDIRAPNLFDLFLGAQCSGGGVVEPGGAAQVFVTTCAGGNPNLQPEIADTTAFGFVYRPAWLSGFSMSIDYYAINIDDAIVTQNAQTIVNQCYGVGGPAIPSVCTAIEAPFAGTLREAIIRTGGVNVASLNTNGIDIEIGYRRNLEDLNADWKGSVDLRAMGAYVGKFESTTAGILTNNLGMHVNSEAQFGGALKWRWLFTGSYNLGPSSTTVTARYIGPGVFSNWAPNDVRAIDKNKIDSVTYFDLTQTWSTEILGAKTQFFGVIENLFDANPPKIPNAEGAAYADAGTSPLYFDLIGRSWRLGVRFQY